MVWKSAVTRKAYETCGITCKFYEEHCEVLGVLVTERDCEKFELKDELQAEFEKARAKAIDSNDIGVWNICPNCKSYRESCSKLKKFPDERWCESFELSLWMLRSLEKRSREDS